MKALWHFLTRNPDGSELFECWWFLPLVLGALLVAGGCSARGNLGDDQAAVEARYGKPSRSSLASDGSTMVIYKKGGFQITVNFVNGRSDMEAFVLDGEKPFTDNLLDGFLSVHSEGESWVQGTDDEGRRCWSRRTAYAVYSPKDVLGPSFMILRSSSTDAPKTTPAPSPKSSPRMVATIKGNGDKTCDPFTITGEDGFTVEYQTTGSYLGVTIRRKGEKRMVASASLNTAGKDHTFVAAGAGTYYIEVSAVTGEYAITVRE